MPSSIQEFLMSPDWDVPFFKRLARNDTGSGAGHQAGMVITKDLRKFFPALDEGKTSVEQPTIDRMLHAEMFVGVKQVGEGQLRYQFQTWGGTRSAESRITEGFRPLHSRAQEGDILVFQRDANTLDRFRLILVRKGRPGFREINLLVGKRSRGPLFIENQPVTQTDLEKAADELESIANEPFSLTKQIARVESHQFRIARSSVFPLLVRQQYDWQCCISGIQLETPRLIHEVEAAHVVPVTEGGTDDIRNGLSLSRTLHWAFDQGLFGIRPNRTVYIPRRVMKMTSNAFLKQFQGRTMAETRKSKFRVHEDALDWHRDHRVKMWE